MSVLCVIIRDITKVDDVLAICEKIEEKDSSFEWKLGKSDKYRKYLLFVRCKTGGQAHKRGIWLTSKFPELFEFYWIK